MKRILPLLCLFLMLGSLWLAACQPPEAAPAATAQPTAPSSTPAPTAAPTPAATPTLEETETNAWWNDAVFYEIFVRSFADSDGDGIGDFRGLTERLDYLNDGDPSTTDDLGVTALWLMPIFPSPSYHGYDVTDYRTVNPQYGTLEDFRNLLDAAHQRGIRVIIDFVINHTSSEHPWFQAAQADPTSPYRDYYICSENDPGTVGPWGETVWHRGMKEGYYYGVFTYGMPDLNYRNPAVTAEIEDITRFWLSDVGVDGFRVDAARHLIEDGQKQVNTPETHAWFQAFRTFYKGIKPDAMVVGEVWDNSYAVAKYLKGDELDLAFAFDLATALMQEVNDGIAERIDGTAQFELDILPAGHFATFLTNHDQDRVMGKLGGDIHKAKAAATLLLTLPGTPFVYYGEEIGMVGGKPDENIRTPMQWSAEAQAGFTSGTPWRAVNADYPEKNVALQVSDDASLLSHYRALIHARNGSAALRGSELRVIPTGERELFAMLRSDGEHYAMVLVNLGGETVRDVRLSLDAGMPVGAYAAQMLLGDGQPQALTVNATGGFEDYAPLAEIPPHASLILSLEPAP